MTKFYQIVRTDIAVVEVSDEELRELSYEGTITDEDRLEYINNALEEDENLFDWSGYDLKITEIRR